MAPRAALALALLSLAAPCSRCRGGAPAAPDGALPPPPDGGERIRTTEAAPLGPSPDRREVDVPLAWIYLLTDPAPTGSTPHAVVGARLPCGYEPLYLTSTKDGRTVRIRMRAGWGAPGPVPEALPACEPVTRAFLVSEGILRVGDWEVVDQVPHGPGDVPPPVTRVQHVVPDDANLPPIAARWTRGCATDADCAGGGVCASADGGRLCLPEIDPWLSNRAPCVDGATAVDVQHAGNGGTRTWRACVAACENNACARGLACSPHGLCLPAATGPAAAHGS